MKILVSACLMGLCCRYDGGSGRLSCLDKLLRLHTLIPFCPEQAGGLPTPRVPAEIINGAVITKSGGDVSAEFARGAGEAVKLAKLCGCRYAILKEKSPSCGSGKIYDGTFTGKLISGDGVTAAALKKAGLTVIGESEAEKLVSVKE